jgi:hypothetical protein
MIIFDQILSSSFEEMTWSCDKITKKLDDFYESIDSDARTYLEFLEITDRFILNVDCEDEYITFGIRVYYYPSTIGHIKCTGNGKIIEVEIYPTTNNAFKLDYETYSSIIELKGNYIMNTELAKIRFVKNNLKIKPTANKQILWFIANFAYFNMKAPAARFIFEQFRAGYCLHFAMILKELFHGEICWAAPFGHIVYMHDRIAYDIEGVNISDCDYYIPISYIKDGLKDFTRVPGHTFNASEEYIQDAIDRYKRDNNIT